jgi:hypothetical protein
VHTSMYYCVLYHYWILCAIRDTSMSADERAFLEPVVVLSASSQSHGARTMRGTRATNSKFVILRHCRAQRGHIERAYYY